MGIKRVVDVDFWNDEKVMDMFTPEDKLFFLYLLTNPHTTQLGIYPIHPKHISFELGYTIESINVLLDRFENKYDVIRYSNDTKEIAIKNFLKHSIIKGGAPVRDCLIKELKNVKDKELIDYVFSNIKQYQNVNETVKGIISDYEKANGEISYCGKRKRTKKKTNGENENENENENDVSYNDTWHDTSNDTLNNKTKLELTNEFETLWELYPNKKGKDKALKSYIKARSENTGYETIKQGILNYAKECELKNRDKQYIKHGSTWFNNHSWNDEYDLTPNSNNNQKQLNNNQESTGNVFMDILLERGAIDREGFNL